MTISNSPNLTEPRLEEVKRLGTSLTRRNILSGMGLSGDKHDAAAEEHRTRLNSLIREAANGGCVHRLRFFDRLMNPKHDIELIRTVFVHSNILGIPLDGISTDHVESYRQLVWNTANSPIEIGTSDADLALTLSRTDKVAFDALRSAN